MPTEPAINQSDARRFPGPVLQAFMTAALNRAGLAEPEAGAVAALMLEADLVGADAHGIFRLPQYVRRLEAGGVNARPAIEVRRTGPATALVDGDNGMGHLVMARAAATAVELARECGVAWVGTCRSNHAGPASIYAAIPVTAGMVGLYSAVASANHMAPWGGTDLLLGTNPLAIGIPAGEEAPVILDIATTVVSYGTIKSYALQGMQLAQGWMIDRQTGAALTDPARTGDGVLLPIGGYKGAGLALALGLLAGPLNGAAVGADVVDFNVDAKSAANTGQFIVALDIARFVEPQMFAAAVDRHVRELRGSALLPGVKTIRLPGEERARRRAKRVAEGVPLPEAVLEGLESLAARLGIGGLV